MKKAIVVLSVLCLVGTASATTVTEWCHDWSDNLDYISPRAGVENLRNWNGGAVMDATAHGYSVVDVNMYDPLFGEQWLDMTPHMPADYPSATSSGGEFCLSLMIDFSTAENPPDPPPATGGFWLRVYSGTYDPGDPPDIPPSYGYNGWQNYFFDVPADGMWHDFCVDFWPAWVDDGAGGLNPPPGFEPWDDPAKGAQIYKFRMDAVVWDPDNEGPLSLVPYTFGIDHACFTPEPATLALIGFGGLVLLRRRR